MDINLVKQVLFALFTDYRLWIAAGGTLFFWLIASLAADTSEGMALPKVHKGGANRPKGLKMPKLPKSKGKKASPSPESENGDLDDLG